MTTFIKDNKKHLIFNPKCNQTKKIASDSFFFVRHTILQKEVHLHSHLCLHLFLQVHTYLCLKCCIHLFLSLHLHLHCVCNWVCTCSICGCDCICNCVCICSFILNIFSCILDTCVTKVAMFVEGVSMEGPTTVVDEPCGDFTLAIFTSCL